MKNNFAFLLTLLTAGSVSSQTIIINELMYAPAGGEPEWIELYNVSADSVNIKDWNARNKNGRYYLLSSSDFYVPADSYLVVTKSDTFFTFHRNIPSRVLVCPAIPTAFMTNTGDTISIHNAAGNPVDSVFYQPSWGGSGGRSLERVSPEISPFTSENWGTSIDSSGSTPGKRNSITAYDYDLKIASFSAELPAGNSQATFRIDVKNSGIRSTSPFDVNVFVDYNRDSMVQQSELVASSANIPGLNRGDSAMCVLQSTVSSKEKLNACAVVSFSSDEDTANNTLWTPFRISYTKKSLVVNEIMYAPTSPEPEWVELFNSSTNPVDLDGFTLSDNSNAGVTITNTDYSLRPDSYVVIAHDSNFYNIHPAVLNGVLIVKIPSLNNSGDVVAIHDALGNLIDSVSYSPSWGGNSGGKSLERISPAGSSDDPQNFETCTDRSKSTPGKTNSVTPRDNDIAVGNISLNPATIQSGKSVAVIAYIVNKGMKLAPGATAIFFADKNDNGIFDAGEFIDSLHVQSLLAGDSTALSYNTGTLQYGQYHFGIYVIFSEDELPLNNTKIITINVGLPSLSVVINEFMYAPKSPEQEWIELYNACDMTVDISNFRIATHGGSTKIGIAPALPPGGFAVICKDSSVSQLHYPVANLINQSCPSLNNSGDNIGLYDNLGNLLDTVSYHPSYGGSGGKSLERIDYLAYDDSTNWKESVDSTGATPGWMNSTAILPYDIEMKRIDFAQVIDLNLQTRIDLIVENCGRTPTTLASVSIQIFYVETGDIAFSDNRTMNLTLQPHDSVTASFNFSPALPGKYEILGTISALNDQRQRNDTLSALFDVRYQSRSIVLNEIMYSSAPAGEYFEIYNASNNPIDIGGWTYHTASTQSKPLYLAGTATFLRPEGYFVVAADSSILNLISDTSCVRLVKSLSLRDDGDCIVVMDPTGTIVDSVYYLPSWHNADIARTSGRSLEKINPLLPCNEKASWSTCVSQAGGTPGKRNSLYVDAGTATGSISVEPNPFSPDGDGRDDFTFISYSFPVSSVKVRIRIFDSVGRLIATPTDNAVLPSSGKIVWDGRDNSGKIVRFGLYILFMEVTGPNGKSLSTYKKPLVVAKKMR